MGIRTFCKIGVVLSTLSGVSAYAEVMELNLGSLQFNGTHAYDYEGEFGEYLQSSSEGTYGFTVCNVNLGLIQHDLGLGAISWVRITSLDESSTVLNPGPDIDLFALEGGPTDIETIYEYSGPNSLYHNASSASLAPEVAAVDFLIGDMDEDHTFVSLGAQGSLTMWFEYSDPGDGSDGDEAGDQISDGSGLGEDESNSDQNNPASGGESTEHGSDSEDESEGDQPEDGPVQPDSGLDPDLDELEPDLIDDDFVIQSYRVGISDESMWLRLHEIAGISEWFMIDIGYMEASSGDPGVQPVPGLAGIGVLVAGASALRRRRRR